MITITLPNSNPHALLSGLTIKSFGQSIPQPEEIPFVDFDFCDLECEYTEWVFAKSGSTNFWENDKNSFLFRKLINSDIITIKLFKNGIETATITDNTYGEYFDGFPNGTDEQQLYVGFIIDWQKVLDLEGTGSYEIIVDLDILGTQSTFESHSFELYNYTDIIANGTVRIETTQNGNIIGSDFDYTGLNWYQSVRIKGRLIEESPEIEKINYITQNYQKKQVQYKIIPRWTLNTDLIPIFISRPLIQDNLLANEFLVTDYNIFSEDIYRRISLYVEEVNKENISANRNSVYEITFTNRLENLIKRNF